MSFARQLTAASAVDREGTDFYPTPPDVTHALMDYLQLPTGTHIWEPACGQGHISDVLLQRGMVVRSTDLHDRGYGEGGIDFLEVPAMRSDWMITNPPFAQSEAFIRHALELGKPFALLLKGQYWHSKRRQALFNNHRPVAVLPLTWRPDFLMGRKGGSPTMEAAWTVWHPTPAAATEYRLLSRPLLAPAPASAGPGG